jgi:DNA polymerase III delta prime subunit
MKSTAELTAEYIKSHADIKSCLKKDLINYSSLARTISKEIKKEKKTSQEAILVAARRYQQTLENNKKEDQKIKDLIDNSEYEIKNKINVIIIQKKTAFEKIERIQNKIKNNNGLFFLLEGSESYTIITQEKYSEIIKKEFKEQIIKENKELVLLNIKSSSQIENTKGVVSYLTSLFAENDINILEFFSCWTDTVFTIEKKYLKKIMEILKF